MFNPVAFWSRFTRMEKEVSSLHRRIAEVDTDTCKLRVENAKLRDAFSKLEYSSQKTEALLDLLGVEVVNVLPHLRLEKKKRSVKRKSKC